MIIIIQKKNIADIVNIANEKGLIVAPLLSKDSDSLFWELMTNVSLKTEQIYQRSNRQRFLKQGVTMLDSNSIFFKGDIEIGMDVEIEANVIFEGKIKIGNNVKISSNTIIKS